MFFPLKCLFFDRGFPASHVWGQTRETIRKNAEINVSQSSQPGWAAELAVSTQQRPKVVEAAGSSMWKTQQVIETLIYLAKTREDYYSHICRKMYQIIVPNQAVARKWTPKKRDAPWCIHSRRDEPRAKIERRTVDKQRLASWPRPYDDKELRYIRTTATVSMWKLHPLRINIGFEPWSEMETPSRWFTGSRSSMVFLFSMACGFEAFPYRFSIPHGMPVLQGLLGAQCKPDISSKAV